MAAVTADWDPLQNHIRIRIKEIVPKVAAVNAEI
jgi:hypothetical protein